MLRGPGRTVFMYITVPQEQHSPRLTRKQRVPVPEPVPDSTSETPRAETLRSEPNSRGGCFPLGQDDKERRRIRTSRRRRKRKWKWPGKGRERNLSPEGGQISFFSSFSSFLVSGLQHSNCQTGQGAFMSYDIVV